jgi:uncharacterized protein (DUF2147 family)
MSLRNCNLLLIQARLWEGRMSCRLGVVVAIFVACAGVAPAKAQTRAGPDGVWVTQAGDAKIRVSRCGGGLCGVVVWLKEPIDPVTGKPQIDDKNPNPALAKRRIVGLALFSGMRSAGPNKWAGKIYNADDGKTYASTVSVTDPTRLRVEGCVGAFCGGEDWTRTSR